MYIVDICVSFSGCSKDYDVTSSYNISVTKSKAFNQGHMSLGQLEVYISRLYLSRAKDWCCSAPPTSLSGTGGLSLARSHENDRSVRMTAQAYACTAMF